jgi:hypothetical protein
MRNDTDIVREAHRVLAAFTVAPPERKSTLLALLEDLGRRLASKSDVTVAAPVLVAPSLRSPRGPVL